MTNTIKGYSIDLAKKTITLTNEFMKKANNVSTGEFKELATLYQTFPAFKYEMRKAEKKVGKKTHHGLTVERMLKLIALQPDSQQVMKEYNTLLSFYGKEVADENGKKTIRAPYGKVKSWFLKKYPNYKELLDEAFGINDENQAEENKGSSDDENISNIIDVEKIGA